MAAATCSKSAVGTAISEVRTLSLSPDSACRQDKFTVSGFETDIAEFSDQVRGPAVDVVVLHISAHVAHAIDGFFDAHVEGLRDCFGGCQNIVWVDEDGVMQLARRAGELAENQDATLVRASGNKFLGHQIHAIVEGGDHAQMRHAVVALHLAMIVLAILKDDRPPLTAFEA